MPLACVLISDITGSTQLYEKESNERALEFISPVLDRMRELIAARDGHCVKSKGDDTIAFFRHPDWAFEAAWDMINEDWDHGMSIHAGMYFGEVLHQEAGLYGNAVNTAARLASLAKPGEVLIGENCFNQMSEHNQIQDSCSILVAKRTQQESNENCRPHTGNRRRPNLLLRQTQILLDFWQERCDGKPSKECDKEGKPCAVKGSHVWTSKATKVDFLGTILLVLVHR